jgi:hypothetical protein
VTFVRVCILISAVTSLSALHVVGAEKQFTVVAPNVVVANAAMAAELQSLTWKTAKKIWVPAKGEVLRVVNHLNTGQAKKELLACATPAANMAASLERVGSSRYQVFGFVIDARKRVLIEASPAHTSFDRFLPDLWQKEILSVRVQDGGAGYWWALYDVEDSRFVTCNRRPDI